MIGVVIPVGEGRRENLLCVLGSLRRSEAKPRVIVLVCDGEAAWLDDDMEILHAVPGVPVAILRGPKHSPGMEQPRNAGVRLLTDLPEGDPRFCGITHAWFLDSDVVVEDALDVYHGAVRRHPNAVLIGPYDWLYPGQMPGGKARPDFRWPAFVDAGPDPVTGDLSVALACFSGNLVWPIEEFKRVGGFWNELHHGRCEDGELGLRAAAMGVPMLMCGEARGYHLWHGGDPVPTQEYLQYVTRLNAIDVPKIKERHPYQQLGEGEELFVVDEDGKRFDVRCSCGEQFNTALIWEHRRECRGKAQGPGERGQAAQADDAGPPGEDRPPSPDAEP